MATMTKDQFLQIPGMKARMEQLAKKHGFTVEEMLYVIQRESNFDPAGRNEDGGATGLIQFYGDLYKEDGKVKVRDYKTINGKQYKLNDIRKMSALEQMELIDEYFVENHKKGEDPYITVAYPKAKNMDMDAIIGGPNDSIAKQNPQWVNEDGNVTKQSILNYGSLDKGKKYSGEKKEVKPEEKKERVNFFKDPNESISDSIEKQVAPINIIQEKEKNVLIDNEDGTFTKVEEDGTEIILKPGLDSEGNSILIPQGPGTEIPKDSVVKKMPPPPSSRRAKIDVDNDGVLDPVDLIDNRIKKEQVESVNDTEKKVEPVVADDIEVKEKVDLKSRIQGLGDAGRSLLQGAAAIVDGIGGPGAIISAIMGKKGLKAAMKQIEPQAMPELSPSFMEHLRQTKELSKKGFHPAEEMKFRKELDKTYQIGLENAVRGSGGQRAKFLAQSGVLDAQRSAALLDYAVADDELQRKNQDKYEKMMLFKENFDIQRTDKQRTEDMERQIANKKAAADFTSAALTNVFSSLNKIDVSGLVNKFLGPQSGGLTVNDPASPFFKNQNVAENK